ncbi:MAG TPA: GLUG motif-containing protein, partial [Rhizomicrobium sp.]|nr:GLUG motif-containing protein [Rhizomicrobium sp.]
AKLGWSANALTLDAYQSISVTASVTVRGASGLSILTNDGGSGGELSFSTIGHVTFKKLSDSLSINGAAYTMVNSVKSLAGVIAANPSGRYALANNYDASQDGTYHQSPITTPLKGDIQGLGNSISNLSIDYFGGRASIGLLVEISTTGTVAGLRMEGVNYSVTGSSEVGGIVGTNFGTLLQDSVSGVISSKHTGAGGLVGLNGGVISLSSATARVVGASSGGLAGSNSGGNISNSHATGEVAGVGHAGEAGGLAGFNDGTISNSYATGKTKGSFSAGGLVGTNDGEEGGGVVQESFATGEVIGGQAGGLVGFNEYGVAINTYALGKTTSNSAARGVFRSRRIGWH